MLTRYYKRKMKERIFDLIKETDQWKEFRRHPMVNSATMLRFKRSLYPSLQTVIRNPEKPSLVNLTLASTMLKQIEPGDLLNMVNPVYNLDFDFIFAPLENANELSSFDRLADKISSTSLATTIALCYEVALENIALHKFH